MGALISIITSKNPKHLSKVIELKDDGTLTKEVSGHLQIGEIALHEVETLPEFAEIIDGLGPENACMYGVPKDRDAKKILSRKKYAKREETTGYTMRTREHIEFPEGQPGIMMFDYDPPSGVDALSPDELRCILLEALDRFCLGTVWWSSASSYIYREDNGDEIVGLRGQRLYIMVQDASDIPRAGEVLQDQLWLCGYGRIEISKAGTLLERTTFDGSVYQPERLDFNGGALCINVKQKRQPPEVHDGDILNTREALPDLTKEEKAKVTRLKAKAREAVKEEAEKTREAWLDARAEAQLTPEDRKDPDKVAQARRVAETAAKSGDLTGDYVLTVIVGNKPKDVSVREVLKDCDKYHGCKTLDPIEPNYDGGRVVGILYLNQDKPVLHSFARGERTFHLSSCNKTLTKGLSPAADLNAVERGLCPPNDRYLIVDGRYYDRLSHVVKTGEQMFRLTKHWEMLFLDEKGKQTPAQTHSHRHAWLAENLPNYEGTVFDPSQPNERFISNPKLKKVKGEYVNTFDPPPKVDYKHESVSKWLDHLSKIVLNESDAKVIVEWMAFVVQNPGVKINWALVFIGPEGSGKDTLFAPLVRYLGEYCHPAITHSMITGQFTGWLDRCLLGFVQERNGSRWHDKGDVAEAMKPLISAPPNRIKLERKGVDAELIPNIVNLVFFVNAADDLKIAMGSRRYFPVEGEWVLTDNKQSEEYFGNLYNWYENGGYDAVIAYLSQLELEIVTGRGRAPKSSQFDRVVNEGLGSDGQEIHALIGDREWIAFSEIEQHFDNTLKQPDPPSTRAIGQILKEIGLREAARYDFKDAAGTRQTGRIYGINTETVERAKKKIQSSKKAP